VTFAERVVTRLLLALIRVNVCDAISLVICPKTVPIRRTRKVMLPLWLLTCLYLPPVIPLKALTKLGILLLFWISLLTTKL